MKKDKIKKKFIHEEYKINSTKKNLVLEVISDMHYDSFSNKNIYINLVGELKKSKPDFIIFPGDLIEDTKFSNDLKEKNFFENLIKDMAKIAPLIIVPGNHELGNFNMDSFFKRSKRRLKTNGIDYLETLKKINNVYFLNNQIITLEGITFIGFVPNIEVMLKKGKKYQDMLINNYKNNNFNLKNNNYNILLTHSPLLINKKRVINNIDDLNSKVDLVISGHFHGGRLPKFIEKLVNKTNIGLYFTPMCLPIPGVISRGIHPFGRGHIIVSKGFRKWTTNIKLFRLFDKVTRNNVEKIVINKKI